MKLENIERLIGQGYELTVCKVSGDRPYHAFVQKGRWRHTSLNHVGKTIPEAVLALDHYIGPAPTAEAGREG